MFIKTTKNSCGKSYYHLVETYRDHGKVRHRTLLSLGKAGEDRMEEVVDAIAKHKEIFTTLELAKNISVEDTYILGPLLVLNRMFEQSGIDDVLDKIRRKLAKKKITAKEFVTNTTYQRYVVGLSDGKEFTLNEKAIAEDAVRDGYFGVVTNVADMKAKEIVENYKTLWIVEDAFGELKGTLRARPVFHWSDQRIVGHLMLCFLAYYCEALKRHRPKSRFLEAP